MVLVLNKQTINTPYTFFVLSYRFRESIMAKRLIVLFIGSLTLLFGMVTSTQAQPGLLSFLIYDAEVACDGVTMRVSRNNPYNAIMYFDTLVYDDQHIYMDEYFPAFFGSDFGVWYIYDADNRGLQTAPFPNPFPNRSRFHILITIRDQDGIARSYAHLRVLNCTTGKYEVRHGLVDTVTVNAKFQSVTGGQINDWTGTNLVSGDGSYCLDPGGGYNSTCSMVIASSNTNVKRMTNTVDITGSYPSSVSGVRLETWAWQSNFTAKRARVQGIIDYKDGTRQRLRLPISTKALFDWQYYATLPIRVSRDITRVRTIVIVPTNPSTEFNYFDNTSVLIYRQSNQFDVTRYMPPLPLPGTPLPVLNGAPQ